MRELGEMLPEIRSTAGTALLLSVSCPSMSRCKHDERAHSVTHPWLAFTSGGGRRIGTGASFCDTSPAKWRAFFLPSNSRVFGDLGSGRIVLQIAGGLDSSFFSTLRLKSRFRAHWSRCKRKGAGRLLIQRTRP